MWFQFVLTSTTRNAHNARILTRVIHSPAIDLLQPEAEKHYLVDLRFTHRPKYMAPYKGVRYIVQFYKWKTRIRNFRKANEKFNFRHPSCRNVIDWTFGVSKSYWKILGHMPNYNFEVLSSCGNSNYWYSQLFSMRRPVRWCIYQIGDGSQLYKGRATKQTWRNFSWNEYIENLRKWVGSFKDYLAQQKLNCLLMQTKKLLPRYFSYECNNVCNRFRIRETRKNKWIW